MAKTYSVVVTATGDNTAFQIEVSNIGTGATPGNALSIARRGAAFTRMGFRQLLIFNKELSQAEVNDVLRVMFPA